MLLLNIASTCDSAALAAILSTFKRIMLLIQIIVPLILIVWGTSGIISLVTNPDEKNGVKKVVNKFIAATVVFIIPVLMNFTIGLLDESTTFSSCWNNANENITPTNQSGYIPTDDDDGRQHIVSEGDYEKGNEKNTSSNSSNSGASTSNSGSRASKVVFIGDSRTVQMYAYITGDWNGANYSSGGVHVVGKDVFVAQGSMGLSWLKSTGIPEASKYFSSGTAIVILMGVNDLSNVDSYISYVNGNIDRWTSKGSTIYYSAVTPCTGKYSSLNSRIASFNSKLKSSLSNKVIWIDTDNYLNSSGFSTTDGLHYDKNSSNKIYSYIKSKV